MAKEITEKLLQVQLELRAPKSKRNEFGNFNYRSAEDILEAVKPLLAERGLTLTISDEIVAVGERYYIKATVRLTDGEETLEVSAYAREDESRPGMSESQCTGCSSSYARKYALNGLFCIDDGADSDSFDNTKQQKPKQENAKSNAEMLKDFCSNEKNNPDIDKKVLKKFYEFYQEKIDSYSHITAASFEKMWNKWQENERRAS